MLPLLPNNSLFSGRTSKVGCQPHPQRWQAGRARISILVTVTLIIVVAIITIAILILIIRYSRQMLQGPSREILHCTSCYLGRNQRQQHQELQEQKKEEGKEERAKEVCGRAAGRAFLLTVVGFFLTPRTWGARVCLSKEQMELWIEDKVTKTSSPGSSAPATHSRDHHSKLGKTFKERTPSNKDEREEEEVDLEGGLEACQTTMVVQSQVDAEGSRWGRKPGRRAHLTLGCAEGVRPVQAGKDLENILDELDLEADEKTGAEVDEGRLYIAEDAIYLELNQPVTFTSLFTGGY